MRARAISTIWIFSGFDKVASLEAVGMNAPALLAVADRGTNLESRGRCWMFQNEKPDGWATGLQVFGEPDRALGRSG